MGVVDARKRMRLGTWRCGRTCSFATSCELIEQVAASGPRRERRRPLGNSSQPARSRLVVSYWRRPLGKALLSKDTWYFTEAISESRRQMEANLTSSIVHRRKPRRIGIGTGAIDIDIVRRLDRIADSPRNLESSQSSKRPRSTELDTRHSG
eukprot:scaffold62386_cov36-Tisochrysis_lutea.AAC.1